MAEPPWQTPTVLSRVPLSLWPGLALAAIIGGDLANGPHRGILGLAAIVPLIAAALATRRTTALYGLLALGVVAVAGIYDKTYTPAGLPQQIERLVVVAASGLIAMGVVNVRLRNERRLRSVTSLAESLQRALLPEPPGTLGQLRFGVGYESAAENSRVGGDFYAVTPSPMGVRVLCGDVKGKGLGAVRLSSLVMANFSDRAVEYAVLSALVRALDSTVARYDTDGETFATAVLAEIDPAGTTIRFVLAGHPAPLLVRRGKVQELAGVATGRPLGLGQGILPGNVGEQRLCPGDRLLFFTDGTSEARNPSGEFFPLHEVARSLGDCRPDEGIRRIQSTVREWQQGSAQDDAALLLVEVGRPPWTDGSLTQEGE